KKTTLKTTVLGKKIVLNDRKKLNLSLDKEISVTKLDKSIMYFGISLNEIVYMINHEQDSYFFIDNQDNIKRYDLELNFETKESLLKSLEENGFDVKDEVVKVDFFKFEKSKI
ncbi:hypothetical protein NHF50_04465, partial [Flavobacterium sp. NRK F10]|uniref:hypothetical protein n=1 Tax=Flavobacterium sp. NRK F10 TaxID=2954931 RepID=UPI00208FFE28